MGAEQDSWFKKAFGVDPGEALRRVEAAAVATAQDARDRAERIVRGAQEIVENAVDGAVGAAQKAAGAPPAKKPAAARRSSPAAAAVTPGTFPLRASVGRGGKNDARDVSAVQAALNRLGAGLAVDGLCGSRTIKAIAALQRKLGHAKPDGYVDPGSATEATLKSGHARPSSSAGPKGAPTPDEADGVAGLIGRARKGAEDLAGGLAELGGKIADGVQAALDDPNLLVNQLKSPSYVNNPNPAPSLQGGGTASAGDSTFVAGDSSQLPARIQGIYATAKAIDAVAVSLETKGKAGWIDDHELLQSAKNLHGAASATLKLAKELDAWSGSAHKGTIEKGSTAADYVDKVIKAADAVAAIRNLHLATKDLEKKTNERTVNAWADNVGNTFEKAGGLIDLIPKGALPGFVVDYYKGLFTAPKNYIAAFKTMLNLHYGTIDDEASISRASKSAYNLGEAKVEWEGDLTPMYVNAYFEPKSAAGQNLQRYMKAHRKTEHCDLYMVSVRVGQARLTAAIERDLAADDPAKAAWVRFVGSFK